MNLVGNKLKKYFVLEKYALKNFKKMYVCRNAKKKFLPNGRR